MLNCTVGGACTKGIEGGIGGGCGNGGRDVCTDGAVMGALGGGVSVKGTDVVDGSDASGIGACTVCGDTGVSVGVAKADV